MQFGGGGTGEGNGREARLARCGLQGHVRSLGAGVSGRQPEGGQEPSPGERGGSGGEWVGKESDASGSARQIWVLLWKSRGICLARGLEFQGWPWASKPAWRFVNDMPGGES